MRDKEWEMRKDIGVETSRHSKRLTLQQLPVRIGIRNPLEIIDNLWSKYKPETFEGKTKDQMCSTRPFRKCRFSQGNLLTGNGNV